MLKNDALLSLDGLGALASCAKGGVSITNNAQLTNISALAKVGALGKDGRGISLELSHLPQLASAGAAFGMLTELPGALHMANNARMSTPGQLLERLASVGAAKDGSSLRLDQLMPVLRVRAWQGPCDFALRVGRRAEVATNVPCPFLH